MSPRPRLSALNLWKRHEEMVLSVFREALHLLRRDLPDGTDEPALNRALYMKVITVTHSRVKAGALPQHISNPVPDSPNPPSPTTEGTTAESKRPDFSWGYIDGAEPNPERSVRNFAIECKRLGRTLASGWDLNRNYVQHGVVRFVDPGHMYGKDAKSGAMIGYVQDMAILDVLEVVNAETAVCALPELSAIDDTAGDIAEMGHGLTRTFEVIDFSLRHLWVDLRIDVTGEASHSGSPRPSGT